MSVIEEWDSLGHLSILIALNKKLGKKSNQYKNLANATTVKDLIKILEKKQFLQVLISSSLAKKKQMLKD